MWKRCFAGLLALALLFVCLPAVSAAGPEIAAPSAILIDAATGTVLYEKNANERLRPASVTKVMTLLLVMEALDSGRIGWDDMVITSDAAAGKGGSQVYLEPGEQMSMDEMLKSVVVSSANDCATALGIKPLLHTDDTGHLVSVDKARGRKRVIAAMVDRMEKTAIRPQEQTVFISHGDCLEDAEYLAKLVEERLHPKQIIIQVIGPVIGAHSGPGTLALYFLATER